MTRFSNSNSRLERVLARNSGNLVNGIYREARAKIYKSNAVRALSRKITKVREPEKWVFLVGCYNSGTTILKRVLESHPDIACLPFEGVTLTDAFPDLEEGGYPRMMYANRDVWDKPDIIGVSEAQTAKKDWASWWPKAKNVFLEKSIDHSIRMPWLEKNFPNSYFIYITRNPYCVGEGIRRRAKPVGGAIDKLGVSYSPELVAEQWLFLNDKIRNDGKAVSQFHEMRYEDLMSKPDGVLKDIFKFLHLEDLDMLWEEPRLNIGQFSHEILDQNPKSLARLEEEDFLRMSQILAGRLSEYNYTHDR